MPRGFVRKAQRRFTGDNAPAAGVPFIQVANETPTMANQTIFLRPFMKVFAKLRSF
jgi:hypothetical protein